GIPSTTLYDSRPVEHEGTVMARDPLSRVVHHLHRLTAPPGAGGLSDAELLGRWGRVRDEAAFEALAWRDRPPGAGGGRRPLRPTAPEAAFRAPSLALVRPAPSIARRASVAAWLHKAASRVPPAARAAAARRRETALPAEDPPAADFTAELEWRDLRPVLDEE